MDPYYNKGKQVTDDADDNIIIITELDHDNIDELLRSPSLTPSTSHNNPSSNNNNSSSSSPMFLFDYTDLNDMNNNNTDDILNSNDHTAELNYKLWLNSNMIKI